MKQLLPVFLLFIGLTGKAQQAPAFMNNEIDSYHSKGCFNVEKCTRYGLNNHYPIQIGSACIYPGLSPIDVYMPAQENVYSAFHLLLFTIYDAPFDDKKILIARQFIEENGIYSLQLLEILLLLSFDQNKLILAKAAYPYVIDKEYYLTVLTTLELNSSRSELREFLNLSQ